MRAALLVVDMLNDFVREGGALDVGPAARSIVPRVKERIEKCRKEGGIVIFVADHHAPDDTEFKMWPAHCVAGTEGAEVVAELGRREGDYFVPKTRYSAFYNTDLDSILKKEKVDEVEVVGVCTSICVMYTVADLRNRDIPVKVPRNAVADLDEASHEFALKHMQKILGAEVT